MVNTKIKDLTEKAVGAATDEFAINDVAGGDLDRKMGMDGIRITSSQITDLQIPTWTEDHSAADFNFLQKPTPSTDFFEMLTEITVTDDAGTEPMFHINLRRDTPATVVTRNLFEISNNNVVQLLILNNGNLSLEGNNLELNAGLLQFEDADTTISAVVNNLEYDVATSREHRWRINNVSEMTLSATALTLSTGNDLIIGATDKLRLDGSATGDTYITESAANVIQFFAGGLEIFRAQTSGINLVSGQKLIWADSGNRRILNNTSGFIFEVEANDTFIYQVLNVEEYRFSATEFTLGDANNIVFGTTTGTKIGTATTQKIGFWNATPVVQPGHIADADGTLADATTKINAILADLAELGLQATS